MAGDDVPPAVVGGGVDTHRPTGRPDAAGTLDGRRGPKRRFNSASAWVMTALSPLCPTRLSSSRMSSPSNSQELPKCRPTRG